MRALAFLLLSLVSTTPFADAVLDVQAGTLYDSNLSRAQFDYDIKSDMAVQSSVAWGRFVVLADGLTLRATLDAAGELYTRYSGLNNLALGGSFALRQKFGLGALAPWVDTSISAARLEYQNSVRDGWRYGFALGGGKRLSAAWNLDAHYCYEHRTADENAAVVPGVSGAVFNLQSHRLELGSEYAVSENLSLAVGYDYRRGDVASTTLRNFTIYTNSDAIALDPVFGDDTVGYRIFAVTRTWRLGLSHALGQSNSINLVAQRAISHARGGLDYYNTLVGASYVHAF